MATSEEYEYKIQDLNYEGLEELWKNKVEDTLDEEYWNSGKLFEYLIIRAFEIEITEISKKHGRLLGDVSYPFNVTYPYVGIDDNTILEQIDGAVRFESYHALIECKDYKTSKIKVEPLAKMRSQLMRRHSGLFGMFFTMTELTEPAQIQAQFMSPQLILLWSKEDIDYCLKNHCFLDCMKWKYKVAVERCVFRNDYATYKEIEDKL